MIQQHAFFRKFLPLLFLLLCMGLSASLWAQDGGTATIDAETKVMTLDTETALDYHYQMDISDAGFASQPEAEAFFKGLATKLVSFNVDAEANKVEIVLNLRSQPNWDVAGWNEYLTSLVKDE